MCMHVQVQALLCWAHPFRGPLVAGPPAPLMLMVPPALTDPPVPPGPLVSLDLLEMAALVSPAIMSAHHNINVMI